VVTAGGCRCRRKLIRRDARVRADGERLARSDGGPTAVCRRGERRPSRQSSGLEVVGVSVMGRSYHKSGSISKAKAAISNTKSFFMRVWR
jgi:hypothetical protein